MILFTYHVRLSLKLKSLCERYDHGDYELVDVESDRNDYPGYLRGALYPVSMHYLEVDGSSPFTYS